MVLSNGTKNNKTRPDKNKKINLPKIVAYGVSTKPSAQRRSDQLSVEENNYFNDTVYCRTLTNFSFSCFIEIYRFLRSKLRTRNQKILDLETCIKYLPSFTDFC